MRLPSGIAGSRAQGWKSAPNKTTNPIGSIFAGVRLRTNVTKHLLNVNHAVYLVKIVQRLAQHWRKIIGSNLCGLVLAGVCFVDGQMSQQVAA